MRFRGLRLIIDGEGRQPHGGPLALPARITRRFQQASLLGKNLDLQPIPLPFPGRREISTRSSRHPQGFWQKNLCRIGVSRRHADTARRLTCSPGRTGTHRARPMQVCADPCEDGCMPSALPEGEPAPPSGELPAYALKAMGSGPFGIYVHVPFCTVRCGYCDFNTYTLTELGVDGASVGTYADVALRELELATRVLGPMAPTVQTVFFGGGTPTVLAASDLVRVLDGIRTRFGLAERAEVTTEANPDSVTPASLQELAAGRFTRVSMGMQSAVPHVLAALERTHDPVNVAKAVEAAKSAGLKVSLDLIYGTPGESLMDWRTSLDAAIHLGPDHISAYALVVEEGTKLGAQVGRGQVPAPQDDDEAAKYELADQVLGAAGYSWYEVSNWARTEADRCRHNE